MIYQWLFKAAYRFGVLVGRSQTRRKLRKPRFY